MTGHVSDVIGTTGSPVVLMAGGAAQSRGFFPHLERALGDHRVVVVDRPGTGRALRNGQATLPGGSAACAEVLRELDAGPALVVGQSLGGALAVQLAVDHPELVSGLVLLDPTPFNDPGVLKALGPLTTLMFGPARIPVLGPWLLRQLSGRKRAADDLARGVIDRMLRDGTLAATGASVRTLPAEGAALTARLRRLDVPVVILTADRKPTHKVRLAHDRMADALGARVVTWPGTVHAEQWREPHKVNELVLSVLSEVEGASR
jgi:pimeloyl-ACP methyl ester carboxylesterase